MALTTTETAPAPKAGPSLVIQIAMLLAMTVAALGVGWLSGGYLKRSDEPATQKQSAPSTAAHGEAASAGGGEPAAPGLVDLAAITTNLAEPAETWVRLEVSLVFDTPRPGAEVAEAVHQDLLAFVRTLKLHQVEGASGYQHLKADLIDRAAIRSGGHVKDVLIRTLLFE